MENLGSVATPLPASGAQPALTSDADSNARSARTAAAASPAPEPGAAPCASGLVISPQHDALFLDVDGTLLEIAGRPDAVRVPPDLLAVLDRLRDRFGGALALISGRAIDNLDSLFAPLRLPCAGVHGLERRDAAAKLHRDDAGAMLAPLRAPLQDFVARHTGLLLEDKGQSLALHFRHAPACAADAEQLLRRLIAQAGQALELKAGKMVLEVTPGHADKGTAIAAFMQEPPFAGRRPVFLGDDVTDEDGFVAVNRLGGISVCVGAPDRPTAARNRLVDEAAVRMCLRYWADAAGGGTAR